MTYTDECSPPLERLQLEPVVYRVSTLAKKLTDIQYIEITVIITVSYCHTIDALVQQFSLIFFLHKDFD